MKRIFLLSILSISAITVFSQYGEDDEQTFKFGIGTALSIPVSDLRESSNLGYGFEVTGVYSISENVSAFVQAGVHVFSYAGGDYGSSGLLHVPLIIGPRFKLGGFFAGAGVGYGLWSSGDSGGSANGFLYSPQVGYEFEHYQFMLNYTSTAVTGGSLSYFGLKAYRTF